MGKGIAGLTQAYDVLFTVILIMLALLVVFIIAAIIPNEPVAQDHH